MCRLFGLHAGTDVCTATFWLLDAPDSLADQSRRNPDGTGLGVFDEHGRPRVYKRPMAAWEDAAFATEAHELSGTTFLAHVRYATTGSHQVRNTHPFLQDDRIFAHNGVVEGLDVVDHRLRELGAEGLVLGDTDSERVFALITASIRARAGDVPGGSARRHALARRQRADLRGQRAAVHGHRHVGAALPGHPRAVPTRPAPRHPATRDFHMRTDRIRAYSRHLCTRSSVVFASEPMDDDERWRLLEPGSWCVDSALRISRGVALPDPPAQLIRRSELSPDVEQAQHVMA